MNQNGDHIYLGNAESVSVYNNKKKKKILSSDYSKRIDNRIMEFKHYFHVDFFFFFFFFAISAKYFPDARLSPQIRSGPVVPMKSIIFSGNSIFFLDFSYLLSIVFFLMQLFSDSLRKTTI